MLKGLFVQVYILYYYSCIWLI